jgi:phospholipid/cholesterol/gamma-HCH transport system substrate-binding protein
MERDANYTAVGAFVLLVLAMTGVFVYWYSDTRDTQDYERYEIYFTGSVSGLSVGGPVRYLGVDVGRVRRIRIDSRSPNRVQVVADISSAAPISGRTLAHLSLQGVTGLLFIDLQQNEGRSEILPPVASERYPVINSVRSDFDAFLATLPDLTGRSKELLARVQDVFSPQNTAAITEMLANLQKASRVLPGTLERVDGLLTELRGTTAEMRAIASSLNATTTQLTPEVTAAVQRLRGTADSLANAAQGIDRVLEENRSGLRSFTQEGLPEFEALMREARGAAGDLRALSQTLSEDPSRLLYRPAPGGVEIPR